MGADQLRLELEELHALLARRDQALFGDSSEKRKRAGSRTKDKANATGHRPTEQKQLPIVEQVHGLDEAARKCPACDGQLTEMDGQFEETEEVTVVERRFVVTKHKRTKYRCRCNGHVATAAAGRAGIKKGVSFHSLRHAFATHLLEGGTNIRVIPALLGHQSPTTTQVYTHVARTYVNQTMSPLDRLKETLPGE